MVLNSVRSIAFFVSCFGLTMASSRTPQDAKPPNVGDVPAAPAQATPPSPKASARLSRPGIPTAPGWFEELPPAIQEARKTGKDILIDFGGSNWCLPCTLLKKKIFTTPEFFAKASPGLVLVDIDTLTEDAMPKDKLARYIALQKRYSVGSFPSVFLCTPDGEAYAWTTYIPTINDSDAYWEHLKTYLHRGDLFREGLHKAKSLEGAEKAAALVEALSQVRADFILRYHEDLIAELRKVDPTDKTGFLAYLDARKAYDRFILTLADKQGEKDYEAFVHSIQGLTGPKLTDAMKRGERINPFGVNPKITVGDVDRLVTQYKLSGETLQQALLVKAVIYTSSDRPSDAIRCLSDVMAVDSRRSLFDTGQYFHLEPDRKQAIQTTLLSCGSGSDRATLYLALHRIFENQLPDRFEVDCHATVDDDFRPALAVRIPVRWLFEKAVEQESSALNGKAKTDYVAKMEAAMRTEDDIETAYLKKVAHG